MMGEQQLSILDILPEDILAYILSQHGLHASLGSSCHAMRQLSLSKKSIGSICIHFSKHTDDVAYIVKTCLPQYTFRVRVNIAYYNPFYGDTTWPYLHTVVFTYAQYPICLSKINAPRLTHIESTGTFTIQSMDNNPFDHLQHLPRLYVKNMQEICWILKKSAHQGTTMKYLEIGAAYDIDAHKIIQAVSSSNNNGVKKLTPYLHIYICHFIFDSKPFIDALAKITQHEIRIYPIKKSDNNNIDNIFHTTILNNIKSLYNLCHLQHSINNNNNKNVVYIRYYLDCTCNSIQYKWFQTYISTTYPNDNDDLVHVNIEHDTVYILFKYISPIYS